VDDGGGGYGDDRSENSGEHSADGESDPDGEWVQPDVAPDDQWLEQVNLELAFHEQDSQQDQRDQPSLGAESDQHR